MQEEKIQFVQITGSILLEGEMCEEFFKKLDELFKKYAEKKKYYNFTVQPSGNLYK